MSFGTLYTHNPTPRSTTLLALAKLNGLDLEIVYAEPKNKEAYEALCKHNSLGQVPTFVSADGVVFSECIPLTLYFASRAESTALLGDSQRASLEILQWMSFANCDLFPAIGGVFLPRIGQRQIIRQNDGDSLQAMLRRCRYIDDHLKGSEYLVGQSATVADFFTASMLMGAYAAFRRQMEELFPVMSRWYEKVRAVDWYREVAGEVPDLGLTMPSLDVVDKEIPEPSRNLRDIELRRFRDRPVALNLPDDSIEKEAKLLNDAKFPPYTQGPTRCTALWTPRDHPLPDYWHTDLFYPKRPPHSMYGVFLYRKSRLFWTLPDPLIGRPKEDDPYYMVTSDKRITTMEFCRGRASDKDYPVKMPIPARYMEAMMLLELRDLDGQDTIGHWELEFDYLSEQMEFLGLLE